MTIDYGQFIYTRFRGSEYIYEKATRKIYKDGVFLAIVPEGNIRFSQYNEEAH
jgi:hypothetical protein